MSNKCKWLHETLEQLPRIKYPFEVGLLPKSGIYFFYEDGEFWGHGGNTLRIVRIGTHKKDNFRHRIAEHFLFDEDKKMNFTKDKPKPSDRSIFRKNIGRALLNRDKDPYLKIWEIDFEHNEKICDRIIAEIRKSGLVVADFTGHRPNVYFEAGFAMGLGVPVIWTCHEDHIGGAHFDTRQYNHILWKHPQDLREKLINRI